MYKAKKSLRGSVVNNSGGLGTFLKPDYVDHSQKYVNDRRGGGRGGCEIVFKKEMNIQRESIIRTYDDKMRRFIHPI